jgi:AcrR family transcriptional regulator
VELSIDTLEPMTDIEPAAADGRRVRRERGRQAVVDALVDLIRSGHPLPTAEAIAERAGVSVSSLFRYFDNLGDLQHAAVTRFFERYVHLYEVPDLGRGDRSARIARYVATLESLFETIAPIARLVRARVLEHEHLEAPIGRARRLLADQTRAQFAPELDGLTPAARDDLVSLVSSLTSFEAWDLLRREFDRSARQIRRTWTAALDALLPT